MTTNELTSRLRGWHRVGVHRVVRSSIAMLTACAFVAAGAPAVWAQGQPPPAPAPQTAPPPAPAAPAPAPAPVPEGPPVEEVGPPPEGPPPGDAPPGYYAPPPGYGGVPGYGYGVPPGMMMGPEEIDYEEGQPIPPGYTRTTKIRKGLVIGGAVTFGTLWVISLVAGAAILELEKTEEELNGQDVDGISQTDAAMLMIPVAGPFISVVTYEASGGGLAILLVDGIAQAGGLAMLIAGLAAQKDVLVRNYAGGEIRFAPIAGKSHAGAGVMGTF